MAGTVRFGRYILERRLAIGGMAEVFLGRIEGPEGFQKRVVIKRILPHLQDDPNHVNMFLDEARLAARFDHPNLIQVYELARVNNQYCLAMEYIEGEDVAAILDESLRLSRPIPFEIACFIVAGAAEGLHFVHELCDEHGDPLNVVHRDISPANIMVTWRGGIKLVDFGIAKHNVSTSHTMAGTLKGKFSYMSPEQAKGLPVDRRSDIFSLGTILFELLTVSPCFSGANQIEILDNVIEVRHQNIRELRPDVPPRLENILARMLTKNREDRFATADDLRAEIRDFLAETVTPTARDAGQFLAKLFGRPSKREPARVATAIQDFDELPVTDQFAAPSIIADENSYRIMLDTARTSLNGTLFEKNSSPTKSLTSQPESPLITEPHRLDKLYPTNSPPGRRSWFHSLLLVAFTLGLGAIILVTVYRATVGLPWKPSELLSGAIESPIGGLLAGEEVGLGTLQIITDPPGASVRVNGELQNEQTPLSVDNLAVQINHRLTIELVGYEKVIKDVTLPGPGLRTLSVPLSLSGTKESLVKFELISDPPGATILINGQAIDRITPAAIDLEPNAETQVELRLDGYLPEISKVKVNRNTNKPLHLTLKRMTVGSKTGFLSLDADPRSEILIDGIKVGTTPLKNYQLPAGQAVVQIRNIKLGLSKTLRLNVPEGGNLERTVAFRKGQIAFDVRPWADVYLGKKKLGTTPMPPLSLYEGTYALRLVNPELGVEKVIQVAVKAGKTRKVFEKLR